MDCPLNPDEGECACQRGFLCDVYDECIADLEICPLEEENEETALHTKQQDNILPTPVVVAVKGES